MLWCVTHNGRCRFLLWRLPSSAKLQSYTWTRRDAPGAQGAVGARYCYPATVNSRGAYTLISRHHWVHTRNFWVLLGARTHFWVLLGAYIRLLGAAGCIHTISRCIHAISGCTRDFWVPTVHDETNLTIIESMLLKGLFCFLLAILSNKLDIVYLTKRTRCRGWISRG